MMMVAVARRVRMRMAVTVAMAMSVSVIMMIVPASAAAMVVGVPTGVMMLIRRHGRRGLCAPPLDKRTHLPVKQPNAGSSH